MIGIPDLVDWRHYIPSNMYRPFHFAKYAVRIFLDGNKLDNRHILFWILRSDGGKVADFLAHIGTTFMSEVVEDRIDSFADGGFLNRTKPHPPFS